MSGGMTRSSVPNSTSVGVASSRICASSSASRSGPRKRPASARCLLLDRRIDGRQRPEPLRMREDQARDLLRRAGRRLCPAGTDRRRRFQHQRLHAIRLLQRQPQRDLPPNEVPIRLKRSIPSAPTAAAIVAARSATVCVRVFSADAPNPGISNTMTRWCLLSRSCARVMPQAAGAVQMHQRRALPAAM